MEVSVGLHMRLDCKMSLFLGNVRNKKQFIRLLTEHLREEGRSVMISEGDSTTEMVRYVLEQSKEDNIVFKTDSTSAPVVLRNYAFDHFLYHQHRDSVLFSIHLQRKDYVVDIIQLVQKIPRQVLGSILLCHAFCGILGVDVVKILKPNKVSRNSSL